MYIACTYAYIIMHIYWLQKTPGMLGFFVCLFLPPVLVEVLYFSFFLCDDFSFESTSTFFGNFFRECITLLENGCFFAFLFVNCVLQTNLLFVDYSVIIKSFSLETGRAPSEIEVSKVLPVDCSIRIDGMKECFEVYSDILDVISVLALLMMAI